MRGYLLVLLIGLVPISAFAAEGTRSRKIVLIAGPKSHGPGAHDYERTMRLFKVMFDNSNIADRVHVEVYEQGWPRDERTLEDADTIAFYSDGRDGDKYVDAPFVTANRMQFLQKQMDRGCGMLTMHFSTFVNDEQGKRVLDWVGGYFDWEDDAGKRNWYSKISQIETLELVNLAHPVARGVPRMVQLRDEVYWKLRFQPEDARLSPLWRAVDVFDKEAGDSASTVAWAIERKDGGRGFGTSVGHAYRLWEDEAVRKLFLNAIAWTAKAEIPETGVEARFYSDAEVNQALARAPDNARAIVEPPLRALLFTGNKAHAWHNGVASTLKVKAALEADSRVKVDVSTEIEDLAKLKLSDYACIVLNNYANWHDPKGLSETSRAAFLEYLQAGGGLVIVHFANGAFHFSLPEAGESDWPEYRKIVRRVWDHHGREGAKSAHDAFGTFTVNFTPVEHPITAGLKPFTVNDELYYHQAGMEPIEPLITAKSKDTKRDEPLAWAYEYEKARVFQTLLGHSEKTYDSYETREMLRRAVAWTARRDVVALAADLEQMPISEPKALASSDPQPAAPLRLAAGKFGQALDASANGLVLETKAEYTAAPLTAECWVKLNSKQAFNILLASEPKSSPTHWELYSYAGNGVCSIYMPGRGGEFKSDVDICDDRWHHIGFTFADNQLRLFIDGKLRLDTKTSEPAPQKEAAARLRLAVGRLVEGGIGCAGLIDDVRLSHGVLALDAVPEQALVQEESTRLLLSCDDVTVLQKLQLSAINSASPNNASTKRDHWGIEGVGFKWREEDSRDDRWKEMEIGRFLASSLPLGNAAGTVAKGLSIRLGKEPSATVCYDTASGKLRAAWTGGFLKFTTARFGLISSPLIDGEPQFISTDTSGWEAKQVQYLGLRQYNDRVILQYVVDGVRIDESPAVYSHAGKLLFGREIEIGPAGQAMTLRVASKLADDDSLAIHDVENWQVAVLKSGGKCLAFMSPRPDARWSIADERELRLSLPPHNGVISMPVVFGTWDEADLASFVAARKTIAIGSLEELKGAQHKLNWPAEIVTQGTIAANGGAYVVDSIALPFENPYRALFFTSGHDAVSADTMAVCTVHGDVWLVSGINERLQNLRWKRFATGLFQPLGLVAKADGLYVLGRDQITRLKDENQDGEADFYECFNNAIPTSPGGHDYTTCLETDEQGNFYFITAHQGIWRLSADGKLLENIASGLRNPNGLGVGPGPIITAAPQEGNWTPASYVAEARPGDYFGYGGPKITPERPLGWTQPLCFIPRKRDNSSGGQVWVTSDRWGPLFGQLIHLSYGQCRQMLVLREVIAGQVQGGTVDLPQLFDSGAMRGRFNPHDGQLYVSGMRGWTTAATQDGCLQRVRYTGLPAYLPVKFRTLQNGVAITFSEPLNKQVAEDISNYHLEAWNYRYAESYGSPDFKPSDPKQEGHDPVAVESATLLADGKTIFLEIANLKPVHQLTIGYALTAASGSEFRQTIAYTIHQLSPEKMDPALLNQSAMPNRLSQAEIGSLQSGLLAMFEQADGQDARPLRMAAFYIEAAESPTRMLAAGPFRVTLSGYLNLPLRSEVQLSLAGQGKVVVIVNGQTVLSGAGNFANLSPASVKLHGGYNTLAVQYESPATGAAQLRLFWEGTDFAREPIPPSLLYYSTDHKQLATANQLRLGQTLVESRQCHACHLPVEVERQHSPSPSLAEMRTRLQPVWIASYLLEPNKLASPGSMPCFFDGTEAKDRQAAADLATWLAPKPAKEALDGENAVSEELIDRGASVFEQLNCIACHHFELPETTDPYQRTSLFYANDKFTPTGLDSFLAAGHRTFTLRLSEDERTALVAFMRSKALGKVEPIEELAGAKLERAATLFKAQNCAACHRSDTTEPVASRPANLEMKQLDRGCLAEDAAQRGLAPHFHWRAAEVPAIQAYLRKFAAHRQPAPLYERASELVQLLSCQACHSRDARSAARLPLLHEESETGQLPEQLPDLTWAGEKLQPTWLKQLFAGELQEPTRTWIKGRMPHFPGEADLLSRALAAEHGLPPHNDPPVTPQVELAAQGELLTTKQHLDCRQCHGIGTLQATGDDKTKLAPGINFALTKNRLRPEFYRRFVLDPPRIDPTTRMVKLAADGRMTKVTSIYDGEAARQFEGIWHYIQTLPPAEKK